MALMLPEAAVNAGDTVTGWPGLLQAALHDHVHSWRRGQGLVEVTVLDTGRRDIRWWRERRRLLVTLDWTGLSPGVGHVTRGGDRKLAGGHCSDVFRSGGRWLRSGEAGVRHCHGSVLTRHHVRRES